MIGWGDFREIADTECPECRHSLVGDHELKPQTGGATVKFRAIENGSPLPDAPN